MENKFQYTIVLPSPYRSRYLLRIFHKLLVPTFLLFDMAVYEFIRVFVVVIVQTMVLWVVTPCSIVWRYCFHLQDEHVAKKVATETQGWGQERRVWYGPMEKVGEGVQLLFHRVTNRIVGNILWRDLVFHQLLFIILRINSQLSVVLEG
jgi:hypothetical protein